MIRKLTLALFLTVAVLATATATMAQTAELRGQVFLKKSDGTKAPLEGAVIDIFRQDVAGKQQVKSRKDGSFVHAGLMFVGTYLLSVSAPGATPKAQGNVRPGRGQDYTFELDPGDGHAMTEAEAKVAAQGAPDPGSETAEERAERVKNEAKLEAAKAERAKAESSNTSVIGAYKAGNDLLTSARESAKGNKLPEAIDKFGQAVTKYDEGINADPDHPGIPSLLTNKAIALAERGANRRNAATAMPQGADRTAMEAGVATDLTAAVETANKAVQMVKNPPAELAASPNAAAVKLDALKALANAYRFYLPLVDPSKDAEAATAWDEYIAAEPDAVKKTAGSVAFARMLFDSMAFAKAAEQYQKLLTASPDNLDYLYFLGLALIQVDEKDKAKVQEGVNQLQAFADKAPSTDTRKGEVLAVIEEMKKVQNVTPQRNPSRRRGN